MLRVGVVALIALGACAGGDYHGEAPPMMGANEMTPAPGLFTGPSGEVVLYGGDFSDGTQDGDGNPEDRVAPSPYRYDYRQ